MDAFYASVEQNDFPEYKGKPLVVGSKNERGVISAASYEARKFGVKSAMSSFKAKKLCPFLIFVPPRFTRYKEISKKIHTIFLDYTPLVEPLSLDEAYLDVTSNKKNIKSATYIAKEIRQRIFETTKLTASAGISVNKFVAKIASDCNKPNGQKTVAPHEIASFLEALDIRKFYGIGKVTAQKMYQLGIYTGADLKQKSLPYLEHHFKNSASYYYNIARGIHTSLVKPNRVIKSVGAERTFKQNLTSEIFLEDKIILIANELEKRLKKNNLAGKTITLKLKYADFFVQTRSKTLPYFIADKNLIIDNAKKLLYQDKLKNSVRLLGVSIHNLNNQLKNKTTTKKSISIQLKFAFEKLKTNS